MSGDPRAQNLAKILVGYSTKVKEGEVVSIDGESAAAPLLLAVYEEVLKAGGNPILNVALDGQIARLLQARHRRAAGMDLAVRRVDGRQRRRADRDRRQHQHRASSPAVPPERQTLRQSVTGDLMARAMKRSAEGDFRWCYTLFPTSAYASEAEMSLADYEDFYYGACLADDGDPLTAWQRASEETERLAEWIEGHEEVRITAPGHRHQARHRRAHVHPLRRRPQHARRRVLHRPGRGLGRGRGQLPPAGGDRRPRGLRRAPQVRGGQGRRRQRRARRGVPDQAARHRRRRPHASASSGSAPTTAIDRGTREVLLDEKIGGTVHMAVGTSYPESGGANESAVHTDLVCDLRLGGKLEVDGVVMQEDGKFVV